jgi:hypothetical protein
MDLNQYKKALEDLRSLWKKHLEPQGVKWVRPAYEPGMVFLYMKMPKPLSQDRLTELYQQIGPLAPDEGYNKQIRHEADSGWDIRSGNTRFTRGVHDPDIGRDEVRLHSATQMNPIAKQRAMIARTWAAPKGEWWPALKKLFKKRGCAVCGRHFEHYDMGHLDPLKQFGPDNIVPMCSECNNWGAARDVTFKLYPRTLIARPVKFGLDLEEE